MEEKFINYMIYIAPKPLQEATAKDYANTIESKTKQFLDIDIFLVTSPSEIDEIIEKIENHPEVKTIRDLYGLRLKFGKYKNFLIDHNKKEILDKIIMKPCYKAENCQIMGMRDPLKKEKALKESNYKCNYDATHSSFISKKTNETYVEGHHLIPMCFQNDFAKINIDTEENIVSLCPNCHRLLHHGLIEEKKKILQKLFKQREERLKKIEIIISVEELVEKYKAWDKQCLR